MHFRAEARYRNDGTMRPRSWAGWGGTFCAGVCSLIKYRLQVRALAAFVSGVQGGFRSHIWVVSGWASASLFPCRSRQTSCLTLQMQGTGGVERWECDPQMDTPFRVPAFSGSAQGHRNIPEQAPLAGAHGGPASFRVFIM